MKEAVRPVETAILSGGLALALAFSLVVTHYGWKHAISDSFGWRQTQTAISAYFMSQGGPVLDYEVPVLGRPWAIPHEFPLYQMGVLLLVRATGLELEPAGRSVALLLFYASLPVLWLLLAEWQVAPRHRAVFLALVLVSPLYLFWSRTFMIESTALLLSIVFLTFAGRFFERGRAVDALTATIAGALAAAVKPPAFAGFLGLAGLWWLVRTRPFERRRVLGGALVLVLAVAGGAAWHAHADGIKRRHPLAKPWASGALTQGWILASEQALADPETWDVLVNRTTPDAVGQRVVVPLAALGVVLAGRRRRLFAVCLGGFLVCFAVFARLNVVHPYYAYSIGVFLTAAAAFAVVALLERPGWRRVAGMVLFVSIAAACVETYWTRTLPLQRKNAYAGPNWVVRLARGIAARTDSTDVVVGYGLDWSPEVPYYARRRALMWPSWADPSWDSEETRQAIANLAGLRVGALVNCSRGTPESTLAHLKSRYGLDDAPGVRVGECEVFFPPLAVNPRTSPGP